MLSRAPGQPGILPSWPSLASITATISPSRLPLLPTSEGDRIVCRGQMIRRPAQRGTRSRPRRRHTGTSRQRAGMNSAAMPGIDYAGQCPFPPAPTAQPARSSTMAASASVMRSVDGKEHCESSVYMCASCDASLGLASKPDTSPYCSRMADRNSARSTWTYQRPRNFTTGTSA